MRRHNFLLRRTDRENLTDSAHNAVAYHHTLPDHITMPDDTAMPIVIEEHYVLLLLYLVRLTGTAI